jgi:hypothetical protein
MTANGNLSLETIHCKTSSPAGLDFEYLTRSCLKNGGHELSADDIKFLGGALQQLKWCSLIPEQENRLLDLVILVREGER